MNSPRDNWEAAIGGTVQVLERVDRGLVPAVGAAVHESVVFGSPVTTSPGQPVDTGALRASWLLGFPSSDRALISTNLAYAPAIEDGVGPHGPLTLRSAVGGFHSVALTRLYFGRLVQYVVARLRGGPRA